MREDYGADCGARFGGCREIDKREVRAVGRPGNHSKPKLQKDDLGKIILRPDIRPPIFNSSSPSSMTAMAHATQPML
jgi:hypothetical protein